MNILVIGGSYFLGRYFVNIASKSHEVTVFNRGNCPLLLPPVREVTGDRHDKFSLEQLRNNHYDVVVDFCAYGEGDISLIFDVLDGCFEHYIFLSTSDVYKRGLNQLLDENAPFESRNFGGDAGDYILGKVALEHELVRCAKKANVYYTSIRPAFIYGPGNYAPRESIYFKWIFSAGQIIHPADSTGEFQLVYVGDVAKAIAGAIGNEIAYNRAFNLSPAVMETYDSFADVLTEVINCDFEKVLVDVNTINEKGIPLPFPLTKEESNRYNGDEALVLIDKYTDLTEGMRATVAAYLQSLNDYAGDR